MTYRRNRRHGLMGLGVTDADAHAISVGALAKGDPILATASLAASNVLLRMASKPRGRRLAEMVSVLNSATPGLGDSARREYERAIRGKSAAEYDQVMYDAVRAAIAAHLVNLTLSEAARRGLSGGGLGIDVGVSSGVRDARAAWCTFGIGSAATVGGFLDQLSPTKGGQVGGGITGSQAGGQIAGCGLESQALTAENAQAAARLAQSATAQQYAMQAAQEDRIFKYALIGGGGLLTIVVVASILRKT